MSPVNSCAWLLFFLARSLHTTFSTSVPSNPSPPTEKDWYSRLPNTPLPKALQDLLRPGHYPSMTGNITEGHLVRKTYKTYRRNYKTYKRHYASSIEKEKAIKSALPDSTIFFPYNDLHPGKKMKLVFTNAGPKVGFLPHQVAESIPFSSDKIPNILKYFKLEANSEEAEIIKEEIELCESPNMEGEEKYCATSLESLIDFNVKKLGQNVQVLSTEPGKKQVYSIVGEVKKIGDHKASVCHKMRYPYAVHYCHVIEGTELFVVPLQGADGAKMEALSICHMNTSTWSPEHLAFQALKIKPGPAVCHFMDTDSILWVPRK